MELLIQAIQQYCDNPDRDAAHEHFSKVHKAESHADDIRREIEVAMYSKSLFPESRGDILGLLEAMDKVPNQAESVVRMIFNQHAVIPDEFKSKLLRLANICEKSAEAMVVAAQKLFSDFTSAAVAVGKIDELESEADQLESTLIEQVFSSSMEKFDKIILRDLIKHISSISDRAENAGDRIRLTVAKRSV